DLINGRRSIVVLKTQDFMKVDEKGLVHGGFTFSLADYAAMVAVNHPNVVLYKAYVKFVSPVKVGDTLVAKARVYRRVKNRYFVKVQVLKDENPVFEGRFLCIVLESHVLELKK
ncbi:MAG: thioesterase, partial [Nitrososphaeria archaeon]|nr:thioesterase [Nitrososphaeria archaeon]